LRAVTALRHGWPPSRLELEAFTATIGSHGRRVL